MCTYYTLLGEELCRQTVWVHYYHYIIFVFKYNKYVYLKNKSQCKIAFLYYFQSTLLFFEITISNISDLEILIKPYDTALYKLIIVINWN